MVWQQKIAAKTYTIIAVYREHRVMSATNADVERYRWPTVDYAAYWLANFLPGTANTRPIYGPHVFTRVCRIISDETQLVAATVADRPWRMHGNADLELTDTDNTRTIVGHQVDVNARPWPDDVWVTANANRLRNDSTKYYHGHRH